MDIEKQDSGNKIERLASIMSSMPQMELETQHHFADGMYARSVFRPAGTLIVGKVHKKEHFYIIVQGRVQVTTENGVSELQAPAILTSKPGTQRAVLAMEDSLCMTVHRTDKTDLDEIEQELVEPCDYALFNSSNKLLEVAA